MMQGSARNRAQPWDELSSFLEYGMSVMEWVLYMVFLGWGEVICSLETKKGQILIA